jgi:protein-S-isoprenylcysteine O-methyltransferase Ste14
LKIDELFFKYRNYTPIPFLGVGLIFAQPRQDLFIFGLILVAFGELLRLWGMSYTGADQTILNMEKTDLVTNGPYAHIRNPIFTGNIFIYIGMIIAIGGWLPHLLWLALFFFPVMYQLIAHYEEGKLSEFFKSDYDNYKFAVPRFYPRISPYPDKTKVKPDFSNALDNERNTLVAMLVIGIIFAARWYLIS